MKIAGFWKNSRQFYPYKLTQWRDCEIYVVKNNTVLYNVIKKACLALFENKAVGLKMHYIGFQTTYYHADTS